MRQNVNAFRQDFDDIGGGKMREEMMEQLKKESIAAFLSGFNFD